MAIRKKEWEQFIPRSLDEVWGFFSRPENLNEITPDGMSFEILSEVSGTPMYEGMIIRYKISPFAGIKLDWVTEITHVRDRQYFIDEQRFGPYAFWHHQHHFIEKDSGVLMKDILHYKAPFGIIGLIADAVFIDEKIEEIFRFRRKAVEQWYSAQPGTSEKSETSFAI